MNRDEIMALVNQTAGHHWMDEAHIQRFAALVAAAERDACAKVCDAEFWHATQRDGSAAGVVAGNCAAIIRARGEQK